MSLKNIIGNWNDVMKKSEEEKRLLRMHMLYHGLFAKDKHTTNNSAIKFEVLLKQLETNDSKVIEHEPDN